MTNGVEFRVYNTRNAGAGLFFALLGAAVLYAAPGYRIGTATNMGSGYFPMLIGVGMVILGAINCLRAVTVKVPVQIGRIPWRPFILVPLGMTAFALLIDGRGVVPAVLALVMIARAAVSPYRIGEALTLCVILTAIAAVLFVFGLSLPTSFLVRW